MNGFLLLVVLTLLCPLGSAQDLTQSAPSYNGSIDHTTIALIVNTADPLSVAAGEYYARQRHIPAVNVIRVSFPVGTSEMPIDEFQRLKAEVDAVTPENVQAYALAWTAPYRVGLYVDHQRVRIRVRPRLLRSWLYGDAAQSLFQLAKPSFRSSSCTCVPP